MGCEAHIRLAQLRGMVIVLLFGFWKIVWLHFGVTHRHTHTHTL